MWELCWMLLKDLLKDNLLNKTKIAAELGEGKKL